MMKWCHQQNKCQLWISWFSIPKDWDPRAFIVRLTTAYHQVCGLMGHNPLKTGGLLRCYFREKKDIKCTNCAGNHVNNPCFFMLCTKNMQRIKNPIPIPRAPQLRTPGPTNCLDQSGSSALAPENPRNHRTEMLLRISSNRTKQKVHFFKNNKTNP